MSKEIKFLESMKDSLTPNGDILEHTKEYKDIYKALLRLESIENSNPSEALGDLECLYADARIESGWVKKHCITYTEEFEHNDRIKPYYDTIKNYILKAQELEKENDEYKKVLDIIKKKECYSHWLIYCDTVDLYNKFVLLDDKLSISLETILNYIKNGYTDKTGKYHKQCYLTYVDNEWCICDLITDECFSLKDKEE